MEYAPEPTDEELALLGEQVVPGGSLRFERRILGGLGCTMDVLQLTERSSAQTRVILRRRGEWSRDSTLDASAAELEVLRLVRANGIPAPEPLWLDEGRIFAHPAVLISFIDGTPLMAPEDPVDYTNQLAQMLVRIHDISPPENLCKQLPDYNATFTERMSRPEPLDRIAAHPLGRQTWEAQKAEFERTPLTDDIFLHGDYWPGNTLWQGQKLVAVVDFEEIGIGDPALDVSTAIVNYRFEPWRDAADNFLEVYRAETGRQLDSLRFWNLKELQRPMPDIGNWLPSFKEMSSMPDVTADRLRNIHTHLILEELGQQSEARS